ncbi:MAG: EamA family transporter [Candidatus Limnocylindrales bacterium]
MPPGIILLLLFAAILHAIWNVLLKTASDPLRTAGRGMLIGAAFLVPVGLLGWLASGQPTLPIEAWRLALVSGVLEAAYFAFLSAAYKRGDLSLVYPIARGTAPVLSVAVGVVVLNETLEPQGWLGVALLLFGILSLQRPWAILRRGSAMPRHLQEAALFALLTGVTIASYSAVDTVGARLIDPLFYAAMLWTFTTFFLLGWIGLLVRRDRRRAAADPIASQPVVGQPVAGHPAAPPTVGLRAILARPWIRSGIGGLITVGAYLLVLIAYRYAPLTAVAPLRESAIVIISGWGSFRLKEAASRREALNRVAIALVIVVGAVLLATQP